MTIPATTKQDMYYIGIDDVVFPQGTEVNILSRLDENTVLVLFPDGELDPQAITDLDPHGDLSDLPACSDVEQWR